MKTIRDFGVGGGTQKERRQRADGTWTYNTEEYDTVVYWPIGTRVELQDGDRVRAGAFKGLRGIVTKQNAVSVSVRLDDGRELKQVAWETLVRLS